MLQKQYFEHGLPVATALHHFPAYVTDLSADLQVWKDETEISQPLRLHMAYSSGFQPVGHRKILWRATELQYLGDCKFGWKNVLIIGAVGPVRELEQNLRFSAWISFFFCVEITWQLKNCD